MHPIVVGFISGATAGIIMGLLSDILFRLKTFRSSLLVVDGSFFFRTLKLQGTARLIYAAGLFIHLITSGVFGALYILLSALLGFSATESVSLATISIYVVLLWLSMLFVALPVAGEGLLGRKSGPLTSFEQLILHVIFLFVYYGCLRALLV
ncbi:hypothetical protein [Syntrophorhabdus aromaticivorans]|jgi:hypothetical protein|uniref:hypothetical protein n=1 Tax=Syntrophorhabdus aromaticivorans TaxID=328301 RepID=UPI000409C6DC|nr:hypothetical protein [Syntrophorhabdus aromaticivorans]